MLGDDDLGEVALVFRDVVVVETLAINEEYEVAILLESAGLTKIGKLRPMIRSFLGFSAQL